MLHPFPTFDRAAVASRRLGRFTGAAPGPVIIALGGVHGNEPAGVIGIQAVLDYLTRSQPNFRGSFFGLTGNLNALREGKRFIDHDLNRIWVTEGELHHDGRNLGAERGEMESLRADLSAILSEVDSPVILLDIHTTSAEGCPFMMIDDSQNIEEYKAYFPVPIITRLIDRLRGTLVHFMVSHGHRAVVFEGGQHDKITTLENIIAAIWILLVKLGCMQSSDVPNYGHRVERLAKESDGLPEILDIFYRHAITSEDDFVMTPGYFNFDPVRLGEVLGEDRHGPIRASHDARILMPRYQGQGNDGFFLGTEMNLDQWVKKRMGSI